jgi:DNA sulfur modification protein DndD
MLIDKIILRNFRVYYGSNELNLSIDPEKNVSIISGQNGFGKTSFLTALVWCLYGKYMPDVDERYRKDINESGGYKKHANKLMSRPALAEGIEQHEILKDKLSLTVNVLERERIQQDINQLFSFSVAIKFTNIFIPHLACNCVEVIRTFNTLTGQETIEVLIDGKVNELTKTIGQEIFINDFILPKEIAKFFFFDAEKITALAEVRNIEEKQYFSKAYNEVLGIKKYTDLIQNLENLQLRLRKKSANKGDLKKIEDLQNKLAEDQSKQEIYSKDIERKEQELLVKRRDAIDKQEQLIRSGSKLSNQELAHTIIRRDHLKEEMIANKNRFNNLLELAPFAMVSGQMAIVKQQLIKEEKQQNVTLINNLLKEKYIELKQALAQSKNDYTYFDEILKEHLLSGVKEDSKFLLDFTSLQRSQFNEVFDNINNNYNKLFKNVIAESRKLQSAYNIEQKSIQDAEAKASDAVIKLVRESYEELNQEISELEKSIAILSAANDAIGKEIASINKQLSEQTKHIKVVEADRQKAETSDRLIKQLEQFIRQLKSKKKVSLEKNIQKELNVLMHKNDFVNRVEVLIEGDLIDINLFDAQNQIINKDALSKGEQQLYATALLKALVTESNIQFPVFIDSPLQKLDKKHATNIIRDFYPSVSSQVVLFPLLEKELNEEEYQLLKPKIGKACLLEQKDTARTSFKEVQPLELFYQFNQTQKVHAN